MGEYIGVRKYCSLCEHSSEEVENIVCNNKDSKFYRMRVNEILCAPCIKPKRNNETVSVETIGFGD